MNSRNKPGAGFWTTSVLVLVLVGYVLSFGPACALVDRGILPRSDLNMAYRPCLSLAIDGPEPVRDALWAWVDRCGGGRTLANATLEQFRHLLINI